MRDINTSEKYKILADAVDNTNEAFVTIDKSSTVLFFNKAAEKMFGIKREDIINKSLDIILGPKCKKDHNAAIKHFIKTGKPHLIGHETEYTANRLDGTPFPASISFSLAKIDDEIYFTGIMRDLTETKDLQRQVIHAERLAVLGQTVAEITHEIKNPLALIGGFSNQLQKKVTGEKEREKLEIISREVNRLEKLLQGLKTLYTQRRLDLSRIDINDLLREVHSLVEDECRGKKIDLQLNLFEGPATIEGDREKLKQVLLNLIKNSVEAIESGMKLTIESAKKNNSVEIIISDSGPGMPEEILARIYDPFFSTKEKGSGLGLSISKRIIEDHQGSTFTIESKEGVGTTAKICLTCADISKMKD